MLVEKKVGWDSWFVFANVFVLGGFLLLNYVFFLITGHSSLELFDLDDSGLFLLAAVV
jgi:hypothetical protein